MKLLANGGYETKVAAKGEYFLRGLLRLQQKHAEIGDVDGLGLALRMEMCRPDGVSPWREIADRMFQIGLEGDLEIGRDVIGLILDIGGYYKNVITLAPSLEISQAEIDLALAALDVVVARAKQQLAGA